MTPQISNSPEGKLVYLGSHSCCEYGPIRAIQDRSIGGLFHPQIPKRVLHFLYRYPGHHILRETLLIGSNFPAVQNNPVHRGVSTLNPQNARQILQEGTVGGDVAHFFLFLAQSDKWHCSPPTTQPGQPCKGPIPYLLLEHCRYFSELSGCIVSHDCLLIWGLHPQLGLLLLCFCFPLYQWSDDRGISTS